MRFKAITLTEVLIVLVMVGTLMTITLTNGKKIMPDLNKTRCKKAYNIIEKTVYKLINDDTIYPEAHGFADTRAITTDFGDSFGGTDQKTKFRDAFMYEINANESNITCKIYNGISETETNNCFKTEEGTVFGIPDTDFSTTGVSAIEDKKYAPVTIYTNFTKNNDMSSGAFFVGIRYNGELQLLNYGVNCTDNPEYIQCQAEDYLKSTSLRKGREDKK